MIVWKYVVLFGILGWISISFFGPAVMIPLGIAYILGYGQAADW